MSGVLILCATPIGNLSDMSQRLIETLRTADVVFAEDTRRSRILLDAAGASVPMRSYFAGNEEARRDELARRLEGGETVALVTDAGMPAISDPGLSAVRVAIEVGARVTAVPGPSAATMALALSGFPSDRFAFEGFLPRKGADRRRRIEALASEERTVVLFVAPTRLAADLAALAKALEQAREVAVTRELTKLHEEVWRGTLGEALVEWTDRRARGEFTIVIAGAEPAVPSFEDAVQRARDLIGGGMSKADAARRAAEESRVARRPIYEELLERDDPPTGG
ncbi:MAG TPA: 16S rRNA (cytidine(1402)-2'-O)-methyltransferase [Acidimicrobiia bacterium]|nr:16S rRNA (cytidine(1402)-2'-O)-methyltransferase [Acidimicrobiia bacterium]